MKSIWSKDLLSQGDIHQKVVCQIDKSQKKHEYPSPRFSNALLDRHIDSPDAENYSALNQENH